jgi:hypothetical protein
VTDEEAAAFLAEISDVDLVFEMARRVLSPDDMAELGRRAAALGVTR